MSENTVGTETKKVTSWGRKSPGSKRKIVILMLATAILIGGVSYYLYTKNSKNQKVTNQCSSDQQEPLLSSIYPILQKDNKLELKPYIEKIQSIPGYTNDANCMYPIVIYQINRGDPIAAKNALDLLKIAYIPKVGYDPSYGPVTKSPEKLEKIVDNMLNENERVTNQFDYLSKDQNND